MIKTKFDIICEKYSQKDDIVIIDNITNKKIKLSIFKVNTIYNYKYSNLFKYKEVILFKNCYCKFKYKIINSKNNKYKIIDNTCYYNKMFTELLNAL